MILIFTNLQLQAKCDFTEQELLKAKDKENTLAVELGRVESEVYGDRKWQKKNY